MWGLKVEGRGRDVFSSNLSNLKHISVSCNIDITLYIKYIHIYIYICVYTIYHTYCEIVPT